MRKVESIDLIKLNAKLFFSVFSELYLNSTISDKIWELNKTLNEFGKVFIEVSHCRMIEKLYDWVIQIHKKPYTLYEYSYFVVKVANSNVCKENSKSLANRIYTSILKVMDDLIDFNKSLQKPEFQEQLNKKYHYSGPFGVDQSEVENDISKILTTYIYKVEEKEIDELINRVNILKFDKASILLHEIKQEFEECINIYLNSPRVKRDDVFKWLSKIHQKTTY